MNSSTFNVSNYKLSFPKFGCWFFFKWSIKTHRNIQGDTCILETVPKQSEQNTNRDIPQQIIKVNNNLKNGQAMMEKATFFSQMLFCFFCFQPLLEGYGASVSKMPRWCQENKAQFEEALHLIPSEFLLSAHSTPLHKDDKAQDYA